MKFFDSFGAQIGSLVLIITSLERIFPQQFWDAINLFLQKLMLTFNPCVQITFDEIPSESYGRSKAYVAIQEYLGNKFSSQVGRLKAHLAGEGRGVSLSMDDNQSISEVYQGVKVSWIRYTTLVRRSATAIDYIDTNDLEKRSYVLSFRQKDRDVVVGSYLTHVLGEGKAMRKRGRRQRLYTNVGGEAWSGEDNMMWKSIGFEHPATFETLAIDPGKKKEIMDDLIEFTKSKYYYKKIGKPWKRGYLLYGPPGTRKSTMIAAIANFLHYDIYDLELTAVKDNTSLRKLMIDIAKRAIVVIEDIDCSLNLTGKRKGKKRDDEKKDELIKAADGDGSDKEESKVTLSGLLNFMDGLWSASGGERIFVFTTNHVEKIDEALIRRGRMDKHIEMSYCCFESFKVLAKNYLNLDSHEKFEKIRCLLSETEISTADVTENLMPKSSEMRADECLDNLIAELHKAKEEALEKMEGSEEKKNRTTELKNILLGKNCCFV